MKRQASFTIADICASGDEKMEQDLNWKAIAIAGFILLFVVLLGVVMIGFEDEANLRAHSNYSYPSQMAFYDWHLNKTNNNDTFLVVEIPNW